MPTSTDRSVITVGRGIKTSDGSPTVAWRVSLGQHITGGGRPTEILACVIISKIIRQIWRKRAVDLCAGVYPRVTHGIRLSGSGDGFFEPLCDPRLAPSFCRAN